jgi:hypothetical protein
MVSGVTPIEWQESWEALELGRGSLGSCEAQKVEVRCGPSGSCPGPVHKLEL